QGVAHASLPGRLSPSVVLAWGLVRPPVSASGTVGSLPSALRAVGLRPWWSPRRLLVVDALCSQRNHRANCTRLSSRNHAANVARLVASPLPCWSASRRRLHVVGCMPVLVTSSLRPL